VIMIKLPNELLNRLRPLSHALADLVAKHETLERDHPQRRDLARMIRQLEAEIDLRRRQRMLVPRRPSPVRIVASI